MMRFRHLLRTFLVMSMFMGVAMQLSAKDHSKKTFLAPRAVGTNLPMELTTWHELSYQKLEKKNGHSIFSHLTMTPFYQASDNKDDVGEYFGIGNGKNSFVVASEFSDLHATQEINGFNLIHDYNNQANQDKIGGVVSFNPKQEIWGARLDYFQSFSHPFGGLFFKASMPIVYVKNNVGMSISNEESVNVGGEDYSLADFFAGNVEVTADMDNTNLQGPLTHAKIAGDESKFGVADINLALGYKIHETKTDHIYLSAQIIVPTGSRPHSEFLFQPVLGNGKHFGLGARLDGAVELWKNKNAAVRVLIDADYRYLFESSEDRTLGVKGDTYKMAHYYLAGKIDQQDAPLFPAANILTQSIKVKPGSQFDLLADLSFKSGGFIIDLGYNFFYKDEEDCWTKESWQNDTYILVSDNYPTNDKLALADSIQSLNETDLDVDAIKSPSQVTNKVFAGLGYQFNYSKSVPGLVGIGGSYEFASDNAALENYSVWLKLGVSF